jgi:hypothetical protein
VSAGIRSAAAAAFLGATAETLAIVGAILSVIQPDLYDVGMEGLRRLYRNPSAVETPEILADVLELWTVPFSGLSVISNRSTPLHRDCNGRKEWMDLLVALGQYKDGLFFVPGLGLELLYNPGTVVGITGKVLQHGAECNGERACLAFYMRDRVHERLGLRAPRWFNVEGIISPVAFKE